MENVIKNKVLYFVGKEKGGRYYVHSAESDKPLPGTFKKEKKEAIKIAATYMDMSIKDYLRACKTAN